MNYKTIHKAAEQGDLVEVERHLRNGADINTRDEDGNTPLMWAAAFGRLDVVKFLVGKGASVNAKDKDGTTSLMLATDSKKQDIVEFLKQHAAKPHCMKETLKAIGGFSIWAIGGGGLLFVAVMLILGGVWLSDKIYPWLVGLSVLAIAAILCRSKAWQARRHGKILLSIFAFIVVVYTLGALLIGYFGLISFRPMMPTAPVTPSQAMYAGRGVVEQTLPPPPPGAVLDKQPATQPVQPPLVYKTIHEAAMNGDLADVKRHLQKGEDLNARDKNGWTPLMKAAGMGTLDVVKYLVDKGADVNESGTPLMLAAYRGDLDIVKYLVVKGADVNARNNNGKTPLLWAVEDGKLDVVKFLIDKGADVNAKNNYGDTPLFLAKSKGHLEVVEFLKQHGATK